MHVCQYVYVKRSKMSLLLLQLSLCAVTFIQLTASQPTYDVTQQQEENDVTRCDSTEQVLRQLVTVNSQLTNAVSRLQKDIAEIKANISQILTAVSPPNVKGISVKWLSPSPNV